MDSKPIRSLTLDSGALIAVERGHRPVELAVQGAHERGLPVLVPAGVLAEVWRDGSRQAQLARLLAAHGVTVVPLDGLQARLVGVLCGRQQHADVVDGSVAVVARQFQSLVLTSDPEHLHKLDPAVPIEKV